MTEKSCFCSVSLSEMLANVIAFVMMQYLPIVIYYDGYYSAWDAKLLLKKYKYLKTSLKSMIIVQKAQKLIEKRVHQINLDNKRQYSESQINSGFNILNPAICEKCSGTPFLARDTDYKKK